MIRPIRTERRINSTVHILLTSVHVSEHLSRNRFAQHLADILTSCALACLGIGLGQYLCRVAQYYDRLVTLDITPEPGMLRQSLADALRRQQDWPQDRRRYAPESRLLPHVMGSIIAAAYVILYVRLGINILALALARALAALLLLALIEARTTGTLMSKVLAADTCTESPQKGGGWSRLKATHSFSHTADHACLLLCFPLQIIFFSKL